MTFDDLPLLAQPLNERERESMLAHMDAFLLHLGAPGDWGYETKLGVLTLRLREVRYEILRAPTRPT